MPMVLGKTQQSSGMGFRLIYGIACNDLAGGVMTFSSSVMGCHADSSGAIQESSGDFGTNFPEWPERN
jgi:hypothetical protein